jgi:hypothetical protein
MLLLKTILALVVTWLNQHSIRHPLELKNAKKRQNQVVAVARPVINNRYI